MTRVEDSIPMLVFVPVAGGRHIVYAGKEADIQARGAEAVYATTLCGLPCGHDPVMCRSAAKGLPTCAACITRDAQRYPDGATRRLLR